VNHRSGNPEPGSWDPASLLDAIAVPVVVLDAGGRVRFFNRAAEQITGFERWLIHNAFLWEALVPSGDASILRSLLEEALARQGPASREMQWRVADGGTRLMSCTCVPLLGPPVHLLLTAFDAGERRRIEQELRASQERLRDVVSNAPVVLFALDREGNFVLSQGKGLERLGLAPDEAVGQSIFHMYKDNVTIIGNFRRALAGESFESTVEVGNSVYEVWYSPLRDAVSRITGVVGVAVDVTARAQAERYLRRRLELEKLIARISTSFISRAPEFVDQGIHEALAQVGKFMGVDRTYVFLFSEDGARLSNTHEWCAPGVEPQRERLQDLPASGFPWWMDRLRRLEPIYIGQVAALPEDAAAERAALETQQIQSLLVVPMSSAGRLVGFVGFDSVREEKTWDEDDVALLETLGSIIATALERRTAELRRKLLEEQLRQAQKMEAVGRLAGGVAHDFNNLLTIISGYAHLLASGEVTAEEVRRTALEIVQAAKRATELTQQLLTFSRRQVPEPKILDLNQLIARMESWLRRTVGEGVELVLHLRPDLPAVVADPSQVEQVLINLALNARDAMPDGGRLTIETNTVEIAERYVTADLAPGSYVKLSVRDSGSGMDAAVRSRAFEPFFTTKEPGKGTGLGLSIVYGIVKEHHGEIAVESQPGQGTCITIYFPRAKESP
jgi:PAS domain S-box-containing protein